NEVLIALTDHAVAQGIHIEHVPCFKQYTQVIVERLETQHDFSPKTLHQHLVFELKETDLKNFATGAEQRATPADVDDLVRFGRQIVGDSSETPIQDRERQRIHPEDHFILKE